MSCPLSHQEHTCSALGASPYHVAKAAFPAWLLFVTPGAGGTHGLALIAKHTKLETQHAVSILCVTLRTRRHLHPTEFSSSTQDGRTDPINSCPNDPRQQQAGSSGGGRVVRGADHPGASVHTCSQHRKMHGGLCLETSLTSHPADSERTCGPSDRTLCSIQGKK